MKHFLGYLSVTDAAGVTTEIINATTTLNLIGTGVCRSHADWNLTDVNNCRRWLGADCWITTAADYTPGVGSFANPGGIEDPWDDPANPSTQETCGFLPDAPGYGLGIMTESPTEDRITESDFRLPLEFIVTGTVVAGTEQGEHAWPQWAKRVLEVKQPNGFTATVVTACSNQATWAGVDPLTLAPLPTNAPARTTWNDPAAPVFTDGATQTWPAQSGVREMYGVRFVGIDALSDQPFFGHEVGMRYALRFTVDGYRMCDRKHLIESVATAWVPAEAYSLPLDVYTAPAADPLPGLAVPSENLLRSGQQNFAGRWAYPDQVMRKAALTPKLPDQHRSGITVQVYNPSATATVYNSRVRIWDAIDNVAPPDTELGWATYADTETVYELRIVALGPGETITADGRSGMVTVASATETLSVSDLASIAEGATAPPIFQGGSQRWICAEVSTIAGSYGDLDLEYSCWFAESDEII